MAGRPSKDRELSEGAARQEARIKKSVEDLADLDETERLSPQAQGMALGAVMSDLLDEDRDDDTADREGREATAGARWRTVLLLLLALVIIGGGAAAAAMLMIDRAPGATPAPGAPVASGHDWAPTGGPATAAATAVDDCAVPPGTVTVTTLATTTAADSHGTTVRGETVITNTGPAPVNVAWRMSQSTGHDNSGAELTDEGWYGGPFLLQPGESRTELVGVRVFDSGERTWTVITDLAAFADSPECLDTILTQRDTALERLAAPVANPFPAGP